MNHRAWALLICFWGLLWAAQAQQSATTQKVKVITPFGNIVIALYDTTPLHRDNFLKQIAEGWFQSSDFHRVIQHFVVQGGGHPDGREDPGYTVAAEVTPALCHVRGVVGMARESDDVNPQRESSSSQFYIVQGKAVTDSLLDLHQKRMGQPYSEMQRRAYLQNGGLPRLDGLYTVFGEVTEGMEVVDLIARQPTGKDDKPLEKIVISVQLIKN